MSEQYAFAIGFDDVESDEAGKLPDINWTTLYDQVATAIQDAGLPPLDSERWDDFGQGRIFWGTQSECDFVKQILAPFRVYVEEARNLETGYYATPNHTYFVCELGTIYLLPADSNVVEGNLLETTNAIPLEAYRLKVVDPELDWKWQKLLRSNTHEEAQETFQPAAEIPIETVDTSSHENQIAAQLQTVQTDNAALREQNAALSSELEQLKVEFAAQVSPTVYAALQAQHTQEMAQQMAHISELEGQVSSLEVKVNELQGLVNTKVDPQVHADLQYGMAQQAERLKLLTDRSSSEVNDYKQRLAQQDDRVLELERQLAESETQLKEWKSKADQTINANTYADLQQQLTVQASQFQDLEQQLIVRASQVQDLEEQLSAQTTLVQDLQLRLQHLDQQFRDSEVQSAQKVDPSRYNALEQDVADKSALISDLRRTVQQLERDLGEWRTVAEAKVEWSEYQAVQDELKQFKMRRKKGLLGRLFG